MNDYLAKPITFEGLAAVVRRWVAAPQPGVVDHARLTKLQQRLAPGTTADLASELLDIFRNEAPARLEALRAAIQATDGDAVARVAHILRGNAALLGSGELVKLSTELEELGRRGALEGAPARLACLELEVARVCGSSQPSPVRTDA
jgi:HPt (histidine-containing phosphotransfer) domain-containing protein